MLKKSFYLVLKDIRNYVRQYIILTDNSNNAIISYGSNYPSLILLGQQQQPFNDIYTALILDIIRV